MKVIVAGLGKTGTETIEEAMRQLGYSVYDLMENFWYLDDEWNQIMTTGCTKEVLRNMLTDVDVITDFPACYFWEEILEAFPEAKVILTQKNDDFAWLRSTKSHFEVQNKNVLFKLILFLTPTGRRLKRYSDNIGRVIFGFHSRGFLNTMFGTSPMNETTLLKLYRRHNAYVKLKVPESQLLEYNVKQGWDPLCSFLNKKKPQSKFCNKMVGKNMEIKENSALKHFITQTKHEILLITTIVFVGASYIIYLFLAWLPYQSWMSGLN